MRPEQKTKSRSKLYNAISGAKELKGAAGKCATASAVFADNPDPNEVFTVAYGGVTTTFTFVASASTENQVTIGAGLTNTIDNLKAKMLAHSRTGAWGFLHPVDSTAIVNSGGTTLVVTLWPGVWGNSVVLSGTAAAFTDEPFTATGGIDPLLISPDYSVNVIDTTGSTNAVEYYSLRDGHYDGEFVKIAIKKNLAAGNTATIIGKLSEVGASKVTAAFADDEPGMDVEFMWLDSEWHLQREGRGTALSFTAYDG